MAQPVSSSFLPASTPAQTLANINHGATSAAFGAAAPHATTAASMPGLRSVDSQAARLLDSFVPDAGKSKERGVEGGAPPLYAAAARGDAKLVGQLLDQAEDINWPGAAAGAHALQKLIEAMGPACPLELVKKFIAKGAHIDRLDAQGNSALDYALKAGCDDIVALLRAAEAIEGKKIQSLFVTVARFGIITDEFKALLAQQSRQALDIGDGEEGKTPLMAAVNEGDLNMASLFLESGAGIEVRNKNGDSALTLAAARGDVPAMQLLLDKGADPQARNLAGKNALAQAAASGCPDAAMALLHREAMGAGLIDAGRRKALAQQAACLAWGEQWRDRKDLGAEMARAAEKGKPEMVKLLLGLGASGYGSEGRNDPMVNAARKGHVAIVEMLLDHGIPADAPGLVCSPLVMAAEAGQLDVCKILLSRGASVNHADPGSGHTALHAAAFSAKGGAVIRYLLDHGADANLRRKDGASALAFALARGRQQSILALLEKTENFHNEINEDDGCNLLQTYLFNITEPPAMEVVQLLIDKGVAFQHEDKSGYTVLDCALFRGRQDIVDLLRGLGATSRRH